MQDFGVSEDRKRSRYADEDWFIEEKYEPIHFSPA